MHKMNIEEIKLTLLTSNECESGSHTFVVTALFSDRETGNVSDKLSTVPSEDELIDVSQDFFGKFSFLTVSSQLHLECITLTNKCNKCDEYCMSSTFRGQKTQV